MADFVSAWTAGVLPLRTTMGFVTLGAWSEGDEFVWVLAYEGDFLSADAAYYASPDRHAIDPDPAQWIVSADERMVDRIV